MSSEARSGTRLGREDWIRAATLMGTRIGFENLAVEPLAAEVGATKGSFYWHFRDRADLVSAVVEQWAQVATTQVIEEIEKGPREDALARLIDVVLGSPESDTTEWRILGATDHPQIGPVVARVHEVRIDYLRRLLRARGLTPTRAAARARVLYAAYLGNLALLDTAGVESSSVKRSALGREFVALIEAP
jgi:AcrR family transcriptional regulator